MFKGFKLRLKEFVQVVGGKPNKTSSSLKLDTRTGRFKPYGQFKSKGISREEKIKLELEGREASLNPLVKRKVRSPFACKPKFRLTPRHPKL